MELKDGQRSIDEHEGIGSLGVGKVEIRSGKKGLSPRRAGLPRQEFLMKHIFHRLVIDNKLRQLLIY